MDSTAIKEWLDRLISNKSELDFIKCFNQQIIACGSFDAISLLNGIEIVADLIGAKLIEEKRDCDLYPYAYYFCYKGNIFRQISAERIGKYAGAD